MDTVFKLLYLQRNILNFLQEKWGFFYFILILSGAKKKKKRQERVKYYHLEGLPRTQKITIPEDTL